MAEGDGLLNRYTVKSRIGGSNPPLSAIFSLQFIKTQKIPIKMELASLMLAIGLKWLTMKLLNGF